jgi:hypothetical protein
MATRLTFLTLTTVAAVLGGCASSNDVISANVNPVNGAPLSRASPAAAAAAAPQRMSLAQQDQAIRAALDEELQRIVEYVKVPGSVVGQLKVEQVKGTNGVNATKVTVVSTPKGFFPPGAYALEKIKQSEDRSGTVFMHLVVNVLADAVQKAQVKTGGQLDVLFQATYSAQADALPASNLKYNNDYGAIFLPSAITTVNGKPTDVAVTPGFINNTQLAALRAVSLASFVRGKLKDYDVTDRFVLSTSSARGLEERWVKLELTIAPKP